MKKTYCVTNVANMSSLKNDDLKIPQINDGHSEEAPKSPDNPSNKRKFVDYYIVGCSNVASMPNKVSKTHDKEKN